MCPPPKKIRTKSAPKFVKSTKCAPSMSEQVDEMNTLVGNLGTLSVARKDVNNKKWTKNLLYE